MRLTALLFFACLAAKVAAQGTAFDPPLQMGCFAFPSTAMVANVHTGDDVTPAVCFEACRAQGATLCGIADGTSCWAGSGPESVLTTAEEGSCNSACAGDFSITNGCGGTTGMSVYRLAEEPTGGEPTPVVIPTAGESVTGTAAEQPTGESLVGTGVESATGMENPSATATESMSATATESVAATATESMSATATESMSATATESTTGTAAGEPTSGEAVVGSQTGTATESASASATAAASATGTSSGVGATSSSRINPPLNTGTGTGTGVGAFNYNASGPSMTSPAIAMAAVLGLLLCMLML